MLGREDVNEINLGDVQLVNTEPVTEYNTGNIVPNDELEVPDEEE